MNTRNLIPAIRGPWNFEQLEPEDETEWMSYLHRNLSHLDQHQSPFPGSWWSYSRQDGTFDQVDNTGYQHHERSDEAIREKVCEDLYHRQDVDASDIEVMVVNGTVYLIGSVDSEPAKMNAEKALEKVESIWRVKNELDIKKAA